MLQTLFALSVLAVVVVGCYLVGRWFDRLEAGRELGTLDERGWFPSASDARILRRARRDLENSRRAAERIASLSALRRD